jgi:hypothetical protein
MNYRRHFKPWQHVALPLGAAALVVASACFVRGSTPKPSLLRPTQPLPAGVHRFIKQNCAGCHNRQTASGGLNLIGAPFRPDDPANFAQWERVYDRVSQGEMPPRSASQPAAASRKFFLAALGQPLTAAQDRRALLEGRAVWRRMNRFEYENTLRDLLGAPWLQVKEMLPEDGLSSRFNKAGEALDVSHVQMSRYLAAAEYALREAMANQVARPDITKRRYYTREQRSFTGLIKEGRSYPGSSARATFPIVGDSADLTALAENGPLTVGDKDPARRELEALGVVASSYEPIQPRFNQFRAPVSGRYKLRLRAHSFWAGPESEKLWWQASQKDISAGRTLEPVTLYASSPPQTLRRLDTVDFGPQSEVREIEAVLLKGETIMPDAARLFRSRPPNPDSPGAKNVRTAWHSPLATKQGQPGVAFQWLEVEGPILEAWPTQGHRLMFGDLPVKAGADGKVDVVPNHPKNDAARLVRGFMKRAIRRPVHDADVQPFVRLADNALDSGVEFTDAMIAAYSAVLCSPAFVTLEERPGTLDDFALASRLSYFLWNTEPDETLRSLAERKALRSPVVLAAQTERMLADPRSKQFVEAFLDYWLDLRKTDSTSPDGDLYPDYYLDDYLVESSILETRHFFSELIAKDLPARNLVDSAFVMVNGRLAQLYDMNGVEGSSIRRVALPKHSERGGLLTQASVLKVTANGTTTSPVLRGVWINERILGETVPPPPPNLPAVEPDTRGATTIREQLDKHRTLPSCATCHVKIDPPGFALESFDVFGGRRESYRALTDGDAVSGFGKNGQPFAFRAGKPVDPSGVLPDGRAFKDVRELKRLLLRDERRIARNLTQQLVVYSTSAPVRFADRTRIEAILDRAKQGSYGVKSLIRSIILSELFRNK